MFSFCLILLFSEIESKSSVQYIYYKAKHFQHFHYIYNLTRDCSDRIEGLRKTNDRTNFMAEDVVIKIGIVGESTEDKLNSLLKKRGKVHKKNIKMMLVLNVNAINKLHNIVLK